MHEPISKGVVVCGKAQLLADWYDVYPLQRSIRRDFNNSSTLGPSLRSVWNYWEASHS